MQYNNTSNNKHGSSYYSEHLSYRLPQRGCVAVWDSVSLVLSEDKIHGQKKKIKCPYCEEFIMGDVTNQRGNQALVYQEIRNAEDLYFQYPLYFQTSFRGKIIWALNREHLEYLIDYLSADLRIVLSGSQDIYKTMHTQSEVLPSFMKLAKNQDAIIKALTTLQTKK